MSCASVYLPVFSTVMSSKVALRRLLPIGVLGSKSNSLPLCC